LSFRSVRNNASEILILTKFGLRTPAPICCEFNTGRRPTRLDEIVIARSASDVAIPIPEPAALCSCLERIDEAILEIPRSAAWDCRVAALLAMTGMGGCRASRVKMNSAGAGFSDGRGLRDAAPR
jgi:hypothetical protein